MKAQSRQVEVRLDEPFVGSTAVDSAKAIVLPIAGPRTTPITSVEPSPDRRRVTIHFIGAQTFDASNPCSADYRGFARATDTALAVVVDRVDPPTAASADLACDAIGIARVVDAQLNEPFEGSDATDVSTLTSHRLGWRQLQSIESVMLSADRTRLTIRFVGGACGEPHRATAQVDGARLVVLVGRVDPAGATCLGAGITTEVDVALDKAFDGNEIIDGSNQTVHRLAAALGDISVEAYPAAWGQVWHTPRQASSGTRIFRVLAPTGGTTDRRLLLFGSAGSEVKIRGGDERRDVTVGGSPATLSRDSASGELTLVWMVGEDGLALVVNETYLTDSELVAVAQSVTVGPR